MKTSLMDGYCRSNDKFVIWNKLAGRMPTKEVVEVAKNCVEVAAYIAALIFFLYKLYSGYLLTDASVKLSCERKQKNGSNDKDYLAITVTIKKGERGGVELHDAQVRLRRNVTEEPSKPEPLITIERADRTDPFEDPPKSKNMRALIKWSSVPSDVPRLKLPPGDETQLAAFFEVDAEVPYLIEVVILARRLFVKQPTRFGQWRATLVSLPVDQTNL